MLWLLLLFGATLGVAIQLNLQSQDNVKSVAATIAYDMMSVYTGNKSGQVPGILPGGLNCNPYNNPGSYCWWEAGGMFGAMINYWQYTGDNSYNSVISQALQFQRGPLSNYNPPNQSASMGVDDQLFWAYSAMDAVESNFPESGGSDPSWLALAQGVFNFQHDLWDTSTCGGGFHWQVFATNGGYNLKNSISNGGNFLLAARLAYVTGNESYADWANKVYNWVASSKLYQQDTNILYIWDNTDSTNNCTDQTNYVWTYNYGVMLSGAAYMYNYTNGSSIWLDRVDNILNSTFQLFFPTKFGGNILYEYQCEEAMNCSQDQKSFKAYLMRWLATTALLVPSTATRIAPKLTACAQGAAAQCDGGSSGRACGMHWYNATYDGQTDVGFSVSIPVLERCEYWDD